MTPNRLCFLLAIVLGCAVARAEDWPGWRGPRGDGTSLERVVPTQWNGPKREHVAFATEIPGVGHGSPIVSADRVFLASCLEDRLDRVLICLDRTTGRTLWQRVVVHSPLERHHRLNSCASGTPATDGRRVFVAFAAVDPSTPKGDRSFTNEKQKPDEVDPCDMVVAAYDFDGRQLWSVRPGKFASRHGFCTSPVLFENLVLLNGDHDGDAYLVALDRATGKTVWKTPRENKLRSYCVPLVRTFDGREQMILSGSRGIASYDPHDGRRQWIIDGPTEQYVASMVDNGKLLFMTAGFPEFHIMAIRPDGSGNVTKTHVVWHTTKGCAYVPSPVVAGNGKYFLVVSDNGLASCFEASTGHRYWIERIGPHYSASLVEAAGLVYFLSDAGTMKIVRPGPTFDLVAENRLDESCFASPAVCQGHLFIRTETRLLSIGP